MNLIPRKKNLPVHICPVLASPKEEVARIFVGLFWGTLGFGLLNLYGGSSCLAGPHMAPLFFWVSAVAFPIGVLLTIEVKTHKAKLKPHILDLRGYELVEGSTYRKKDDGTVWLIEYSGLELKGDQIDESGV